MPHTFDKVTLRGPLPFGDSATLPLTSEAFIADAVRLIEEEGYTVVRRWTVAVVNGSPIIVSDTDV